MLAQDEREEEYVRVSRQYEQLIDLAVTGMGNKAVHQRLDYYHKRLEQLAPRSDAKDKSPEVVKAKDQERFLTILFNDPLLRSLVRPMMERDHARQMARFAEEKKKVDQATMPELPAPPAPSAERRVVRTGP